MLARARGVDIVELDGSPPLTAARSRNAGFERLIHSDPHIEFVQFIDGDCTLAPGWLEHLKDEKLLEGVKRLKVFLQATTPPHDYGRVLLLWSATRMKDLLATKQREEFIALVGRHQRPDGGWSIRSFAAPETWGRGNRADFRACL